MDQETYDQEMQDCSIEKARRSKEIEMKTAESKRLEDEVESLETADGVNQAAPGPGFPGGPKP